jgi:hypothetical protein
MCEGVSGREPRMPYVRGLRGNPKPTGFCDLQRKVQSPAALKSSRGHEGNTWKGDIQEGSERFRAIQAGRRMVSAQAGRKNVCLAQAGMRGGVRGGGPEKARGLRSPERREYVWAGAGAVGARGWVGGAGENTSCDGGPAWVRVKADGQTLGPRQPSPSGSLRNSRTLPRGGVAFVSRAPCEPVGRDLEGMILSVFYCVSGSEAVGPSASQI